MTDEEDFLALMGRFGITPKKDDNGYGKMKEGEYIDNHYTKICDRQ